MILWETKSLDNKKYIALSVTLDEIGKNLGGWYQTKKPSVHAMVRQRAEIPRARAKTQGQRTLRRYLREDEREAVVGVPAVTRPVKVGKQGAVTAARPQQVWIATRILDGFVHRHDPIKTHFFDLLIAEFPPDQATDLRVRLEPLSFLLPFGSDVLGCAIPVSLPEISGDDNDVVRDAIGRLKVFGTKNVFCPFGDSPFPKISNPLLASPSVGRDLEANGAVWLHRPFAD